AKRDHFRIRPLAQRLEEQMNGNKFKANTVVAIKLARAVYFMLKNKTVFDPDRLVAALARHRFGPGRSQPARPNSVRSNATPRSVAAQYLCRASARRRVRPSQPSGPMIGGRGRGPR